MNKMWRQAGEVKMIWRTEMRLVSEEQRSNTDQDDIRAASVGETQRGQFSRVLLNHHCYPSVRIIPHWSHHNHLRTSPNSVGWQQILCKGQARTLAFCWSGQMGWGEGPPWETWRQRSSQTQCELCITYGLISSQIRHLIKKVIISVNLPGHFMGVIN